MNMAIRNILFPSIGYFLKRKFFPAGKKRALQLVFFTCIGLWLGNPVASIAQQAQIKRTGAALIPDSSLPDLKVHYELHAALQKGQLSANESENKTAVTRIEAMEQIHLVNTGSTDLSQIWVDLYPNGYGSDSTELCEKLLQAGDLRLYFAKPGQLGRMTDLDFTLLTQGYAKSDSKLKVTDPSGTAERLLLSLPEPLRPGDSLILQTPFTLKLPLQLIDLGDKDGVSYLKNWFVQLAPFYKLVQSSTQVTFNVDAGELLYVDGQVQEPTKNAGLSHAPGLSAENLLTYDLQPDPAATLAIKAQDNKAPVQRNATMPWFDLQSGRIVRPSNKFFEKLLPGPLAVKRPLRPDSVFEQMKAARTGEKINTGKPVSLAFLFNLKEADTKSYLSFSPAIGFNNYDQWMPGLLIHNYSLPVTPFQFIAAPLYSTGDHTISGLGHLSYTRRHSLNAWQISLDGSTYAYNAYSSWTDAADNTYEAGKMRLIRIVPAIRYKWSPDPGEPEKQWRLEAKAFILKKDGWKSGEAKIISPTTSIGELDVALNNQRPLYPYGLNLQIQGTDQFLRAGLMGKYFLNYDGFGKGLQLRSFAGKFFYLQQKDILNSFNLRNYFFNLSGSNGAQDVTYSDYFIGRSEYEGWMSQQMTTTGGFFKVSTPYLSEPIGQTDDWLAAINLTTDLPDGINPLSVLPFKVPLRVFMDMGTYSNLWSENPDAGRFLYDAGLQVSVLKEAVTIYFPLLYSKFYRDTYKSMDDLGTYSKRIRFSINLGSLMPKRLQKDLKW